MSACAQIYFAGKHRYADGKLGVHQIKTEDNSLTGGQYAISDIIDVLKGFDVPDEVFVKMFRTQPSEMYVFTKQELEDFGLVSQDTEPHKISVGKEGECLQITKASCF